MTYLSSRGEDLLTGDVSAKDRKRCSSKNMEIVLLTSQHKCTIDISPFTSCFILFMSTVQNVLIKIYICVGGDIAVVFRLAARSLPPRSAEKARFNEDSRASCQL